MEPDLKVDDVFAALSDPTRRKIVELLGSRPYRAGELAEQIGTSAPVMSRHLRILLQAGIVEDERLQDDARARLFRLRIGPIETLQWWLDHVQTDWDQQLAGFKEYVKVRSPKRAPTTTQAKGSSR